MSGSGEIFVRRIVFEKIVSKMESPLVVIAEGGFLSAGYRYLTSYKGLFFFAKSKERIFLPAGTEVVEAKSIWIP